MKKHELALLLLEKHNQFINPFESLKLILPHPLLGEITLREMLYVTAYRAEHHTVQVVKNMETLIHG